MISVLCFGLPLRVRARLLGDLPDLDLVATSDPAELTRLIRDKNLAALVVDESILPISVEQLLEANPFAGIVILIQSRTRPAVLVQRLIRTHHVVALLAHPVKADDLIKELVFQLGLKKIPHVSGADERESLALREGWNESLPLLLEQVKQLQQALHDPAERPSAILAAHRLGDNLGSFELPALSLLARETERLLRKADSGDEHRLALAVHALERALREEAPGKHAPRRLVLVSDDPGLQKSLDMEARLLDWGCELCQDLRELPERLSHPLSRVVILDRRAQTCSEHPTLLEELIADACPCVVLQEPPFPEESLSTGFLPLSASPYAIVMAALRRHQGPAVECPPLILVVDDDGATRAVVSRTLAYLEYAVVERHDTLDFWDVLERECPDLVLLNAEMPTMSGVEICRAMRLDDRYCTIPVMLLSSCVDTLSVQKAYEAGADDVLFKPFPPSELRVRVANRLERCRQRAVRPAAGRTYSSLDQLLLRALREGVPLGVGVISLPDPSRRLRVAQSLRMLLRGEDVVRPHGQEQLLVGMLTPSPERAEARVREILRQQCPEARLGLAWVDEEHSDLAIVLEAAEWLARPDTNHMPEPVRSVG